MLRALFFVRALRFHVIAFNAVRCINFTLIYPALRKGTAGSAEKVELKKEKRQRNKTGGTQVGQDFQNPFVTRDY